MMKYHSIQDLLAGKLRLPTVKRSVRGARDDHAP